MTVASCPYASLDEAWGEVADVSSSRGKKGHRKHSRRSGRKAPAPAASAPCYLYQKEDDPDVDDIMSTYGPYEREDYDGARDQSPLHYTTGPDDRNSSVAPGAVRYVPDDDDYLEDDPEPSWAPVVGPPQASAASDERTMLLEFGTFVFAGLVFIFIMENLVQLGTQMKTPF